MTTQADEERDKRLTKAGAHFVLTKSTLSDETQIRSLLQTFNVSNFANQSLLNSRSTDSQESSSSLRSISSQDFMRKGSFDSASIDNDDLKVVSVGSNGEQDDYFLSSFDVEDVDSNVPCSTNDTTVSLCRQLSDPNTSTSLIAKRTMPTAVNVLVVEDSLMQVKSM